MADREDNVYQAKLAEQAERYEGNSVSMLEFLLQHKSGIGCIPVVSDSASLEQIIETAIYRRYTLHFSLVFSV